MKMFIILRLLGLRVRRPEAFAGSHEPLEAGDDCCAYIRGGEVLVVVALRAATPGDAVVAPRGVWREVLSNNERSFAQREPMSALLGDLPVAVFERVSR
jgi:maltooligosyltrehalose synthase